VGGGGFFRTTPLRYRPQYSNPKPLEQTQNWIKLGGKVTSYPRGPSDIALKR
jgi:hypothetical protein